MHKLIVYFTHDPDDQSIQMDRSKTSKIRIPITMDTSGEPELPSITNANGNHTKVVQGTLRDYCMAHIRE
jgi:hypothetical protein